MIHSFSSFSYWQ